MKTGIILARLQPIHNGHLELIKKAQRENDQVYIFIGSADKFNKRNPIPISTRLELTKTSIAQEFSGINYDNMKDIDDALDAGHIYVVPLDDLDDENNNSHEWGFIFIQRLLL